MITSQTPFLFELGAGHSGPAIPAGKRAYFQERLRIRVFNFLLQKYLNAQKSGLNKNLLAKRIERKPEVINRWLGAPSNLTLDSICDLLLGISAEEMELASSSPVGHVANNYSRFDELASLQLATPKESQDTSDASALSDAHIFPSDLISRKNNVSAISTAQNNAYAELDRKKAAN